MTDKPYGGFGFLDKVTNIHFGSGLWLGMWADVGAVSPTFVSWDFIGFAGGTPGFTTSPMAGATRTLDAVTNTYRVVKADLTAKLVTDAGKGMVGFKIKNSLDGAAGPSGPIILSLDSVFSAPFVLRVNATGNLAPFLGAIWTWKNGIVAAGKSIGFNNSVFPEKPIPDATVLGKQVFLSGSTWTVDPKTGAINPVQ